MEYFRHDFLRVRVVQLVHVDQQRVAREVQVADGLFQRVLDPIDPQLRALERQAQHVPELGARLVDDPRGRDQVFLQLLLPARLRQFPLSDDLLVEQVVVLEVAELVHEVLAHDGVSGVNLDALSRVLEGCVDGGLVRRVYLEVSVVHGEVRLCFFPAHPDSQVHH